MFEGIIQAITSPNRLFNDFESKNTLVNQAFFVVLIVAIISTIGVYLTTVPTAEVAPFGQVSLITATIATPIISIVFWLIYGLLIRISAGIDIKPWALSAYSFAPTLITSTIIILLAAIFPTELTPVSFSLEDQNSLQEASLAVQREFQQTTLGIGSTIVNYLGIIWMLALVFIGVSANSTRGKAILSTVLVGVLSIGLTSLPFLLAPTG